MFKYPVVFQPTLRDHYGISQPTELLSRASRTPGKLPFDLASPHTPKFVAHQPQATNVECQTCDLSARTKIATDMGTSYYQLLASLIIVELLCNGKQQLRQSAGIAVDE